MKIGVPKETKNHEYRVGLTPGAVREAVAHGHGVIVESGAGLGIGASDADYQQAGAELGLTATQARRLAVGTFAGGTQLAADSPEPLATLRERVTSKGGTTYAALTAMEQAGVKAAFVKAMHAACVRAAELGDEFGRTPPH